MSVSYWLDQSSAQNKKYDVAVIGAGVMGLSLCYWLKKQNPKIKIALIEKDHLLAGASGRNAGFVTCGSIEHLIKLVQQYGEAKAAEIWKFAETNHVLVREELLHGLDVDYQVTGSCTVAPSQERYKEYQQFISRIKKYNINFADVDSKTIEKEFALKGFFGGSFYPKDGVVHPVKLLTALFDKLEVDFYPQSEVFKVDESQNHVVISTRLGSFTVEHAFLTTNAYLPLLYPEFASFLEPGRGQVITTDPVPFKVRGPCYFTKHLCYFRQLVDGRLLIGGFRNLDTQSTTQLDQIKIEIQNALKDFVINHFYESEDIRVSHQWSGIMGFSKDGQPFMGRLPQRQRIFIHGGCSGHGMGNSFHIAKVFAEYFSGQKLPDHLQVERFANDL